MGYTVAASNLLDKSIFQDLTALSSTANHALGYQVRAETGEVYEYAFLSTTMTATSIPTYPAFYFENLSQQVEITTTHDGDLGRSFAGVLCASTAAGSNYLWIQREGIAPSCAVSTSVAAIGDTVTCYETGMLARFPIEAISSAVGGVTPDLTIAKVVGTAMQAVSGGLADVMLHR